MSHTIFPSLISTFSQFPIKKVLILIFLKKNQFIFTFLKCNIYALKASTYVYPLCMPSSKSLLCVVPTRCDPCILTRSDAYRPGPTRSDASLNASLYSLRTRKTSTRVLGILRQRFLKKSSL